MRQTPSVFGFGDESFRRGTPRSATSRLHRQTHIVGICAELCSCDRYRDRREAPVRRAVRIRRALLQRLEDGFVITASRLLRDDAPDAVRTERGPIVSRLFPFLGNWFHLRPRHRREMAVQCARQDLRREGIVAASIQSGEFSPRAVTGLLDDVGCWSLTVSPFEMASRLGRHFIEAGWRNHVRSDVSRTCASVFLLRVASRRAAGDRNATLFRNELSCAVSGTRTINSSIDSR